MRIKTPLFYIHIDIMLIIFVFFSIFIKSIRDVFSSYIICYLFIVFHEASHIFVAAFFGKEIDTFYMRLCGVSVEFVKERFTINNKFKNSKIYLIKELMIYVAGPVSNIVLALIFHKIKMIYEINIFLGILNLIPIFPLDGYNLIKNILFIHFCDIKVIKVLNIINRCSKIIMLIIGIIILIYKCNPCLLFFLIYVIILDSSKVGRKVTF